MSQLLKFETRKLFRQKSFYICCIIQVIMICISALTLNLLFDTTNVEQELDSAGLIFAGEMLSGKTFLTLAVPQSNITILLAIYISIFACMDFATGAIKNLVSRGYSRTQIFLSKYILTLISATVMTLVSWIGGIAIGSILWGFGENWSSSIIPVLLLQLLCILAFASIFFMFSALVRKSSGGAIAIGIAAPLVLTVVFAMIDALAKSDLKLVNYMLSGCLSSLSVSSLNSDLTTRCLIASGIYLAVSLIVSVVMYKRSEV